MLEDSRTRMGLTVNQIVKHLSANLLFFLVPQFEVGTMRSMAIVNSYAFIVFAFTRFLRPFSLSALRMPYLSLK